MTRTAFLGTPAAAIPTLRALNDIVDIVAVLTQPDRARGRSSRLVPPPVKEAAGALGLPVHQPTSRAELSGLLSDLAPLDLGVVVAFGRILTPEMLATSNRGFLNVHFSLLPRWRGAAPVERAIMAGDTMTGVTIIRLDEGLDTGPVLTAQAVDIGLDEVAGELTGRLARMGAKLLTAVVADYVSGSLTPITQAIEGMTYAEKLRSEDRLLTEAMSVAEFVNKVRGLAPSPGAIIDFDGRPHKVLKAVPHQGPVDPGRWQGTPRQLLLGLESGAVEVLVLQPPGKRPMAGAEWLRGRKVSSGRIG